MGVVTSEEAEAYVRQRGGVLYVRPHHHRCCGGGLTVLDSTTERPPDARDFLPIGAGGIDVRFRGRPENLPAEVVIELRGFLRRRPVAYWDGCAFRP